MDKLKEDEQQKYIEFLANCDNFSVKHHISLIKCYMKAYVCDLAPLLRIRRSFVAMGVTNNIEQDDETFRNIQKYLITWLNCSATKGLKMLLQKSTKTLNESDVKKFVSSCNLSSQLIYCMAYYAQTKMIQYTILIPDVNTLIKNEPCNKELLVSHSEILLKAFSEICEDQDAFPIHPDKLCSISMDSVPVTLTIALVFHWIFGNSLKQLENLLKLSSLESPKIPSKTQNRPTSIFFNSNSQKLDEVKPTKNFFLGNVSGSKGDGLHQLFSSGKTTNVKNLLEDNHNDNKSNIDGGDTSPEIFLTPTEEELPIKFSTQTTQNSKLLLQKPILINSNKNMLVKHETPEPMTISLKSEFQKKQQQKMNSSKLKVVVVPANETTWLAQTNKNEVTHIPLTPKKTTKSLPSPTQIDSQSLTKSQLNELQIQLGLQRQKIQNNKKKTAQKTERNIEDFKQKAFFQVFNKTNITRRNSLESNNSSTSQSKNNANKRLSLFISDEKSNNGLFPQTNLTENHTDSIVTSTNKNDSKEISKVVSIEERNIENEEYEENIKEIELPYSLQESDLAMSAVQILPDQTAELSVNNSNNRISSNFPTQLNYIPEVSLLEEASGSRKNSSTSISSLSSISTKSSEKLVINQEDYYKSIDILNKSLTSLQQEIRLLTQQHPSWNKQIKPDLPKDVSLDTNTSFEINNHASDNQSVPETPTNHGTSLTEVTDITKANENDSKSKSEYVENNTVVTSNQPIITSFKSLDPLPSETKQSLEIADLPRENKCQHSISLCEADEANVNPNDFIKYNSTEIPFYNIETPTNQQLKSLPDKLDLDNNIVEENNNISVNQSFTSSSTDEDNGDMTSSTDSSIVSNIQPITFVICSDQEIEETRIKKAEMLARREEKRKIKMERLKQKRDQDRENRLSATNDELMEREEKKKQEKEKRDSLLQKYLDRKKSETMPASVSNSNAFEKRSASAANTPVKLRVNSKTPRPVGDTGKQDSVGNLPLASSQRNTWFSSMRITNRNTSQSTSKLHENVIMDSNKFGVPLPPQEYNGPKLFGKRKVKTNRSVIVNAISHCCLAGSVNEATKESVLKELADTEGTHFMILFRDARCQYRAVYSFNLVTDELNLVCGSGPKKISHEMVEKFYKYNSGAKQFNIIISTKHLSPAVDAICIQAMHWNARPGSQILPNAVSITNINQSKSKKPLKYTSTTN